MSKQKSQTRKYKNYELKSIYDALGGLDGINENGVFKPYRFGGDALGNIIKNKISLRPVMDAITETNNRLVLTFRKPGAIKIDAGTEEYGKFNDEWMKFLAKEEEFSFAPVKYADLNVAENSIAPSVIENLVIYGVVTGFN